MIIKHIYFPVINGPILNIGCGEDSIIEKQYNQFNLITNIDNSKEKIKKSPYLAINMDATNLKYNNNTWESITSFFSFGYFFHNIKKEKAINEIYRVLRPGGKFYLWDMNIYNSNPYIQIKYNNIINLYMIKNVKDKQNLKYFKKVCKQAGFKIIKIKKYFSHFYLECEK